MPPRVLAQNPAGAKISEIPGERSCKTVISLQVKITCHVAMVTLVIVLTTSAPALDITFIM